jgi:riboflavin kinase / FMN adenylyltransferase
MQIFNGLNEYRPVPNPVVTIGTFDGIHLGHRQIIQRLKREARSIDGSDMIITFWPHPRYVIQCNDNTNDLKLLNTLEEKNEIFAALGVTNLLIIPFTDNFSKLQPHMFINDIIVGQIRAKIIVVGYDHRFGYKRTGSYTFLRENKNSGQYGLVEVPAYELNGIAVSSTKIRYALEVGNVSLARQMLGYDYSINGVVVEGVKLGVSIGFPTANVRINDENKLLPKDGVYICKIEVSGKEYFGMLNIGFNPTVLNKGWSCEVNILDFKGNIYGESVKVRFLQRIRDEKKFENMGLLKEAIEKDLIFTLDFINKL